MRRLALTAVVAILLVPTPALPASTDGRALGPDAPAHGVTSTNVEHVRFVPFELYSATGAKIVGSYLYVTSWRSISIYDISDPEDPQLVSMTPFAAEGTDPHRFQNEDVATNGKILVFSQTSASLVGGGSNKLWIYDVTDKENPEVLAVANGLAQHTMTCIADCTYLYGSSGRIVDLRDPTNPVEAGNWAARAGVSGGHDVREDRPGLVVVSTSSGACPGAILDTTDPENPKKLSCMPTPSSQRVSEYMHSTAWPNEATDRFMLAGSETNLTGRCGSSNGATYVFDMTDWESGLYTRKDRLQMRNGWLFDGYTPANALGCSAHWMEPAPSFRNGGIFAHGYYDHGTRFFYVGGQGKLTEVGFFQPFGGGTSGAYWASDRIVYAIDYQRGFDVLRWNGPLPQNPGAETTVTELEASSAGQVGGTATFAGEPEPTVWTDPAGDGPIDPDTSSTLAADLVEAAVSQPESGLPYLEFRLEVTDMPFPDTTFGPVPEATTYSWAFLANGRQYQIQAKLTNFASTVWLDDQTGSVTRVGRTFRLRGNCGALVIINNCPHLAWLDGAIDIPNKTISVRVPIGASYAPDIAPGVTISTTKTGNSTTPSIYAANSVGVVFFGTNGVGNMTDEVEWTNYTIPKPEVSLAVATAGSDPAGLSYTIPATLAPDGSFTADVGSIPAGNEVFARACFGTVCGAVSAEPA